MGGWYGAAAAVWRVLVAASLLLFALTRFGLALTAILLLLPAAYAISRIRNALRNRHSKTASAPRINRRRLMRTYGLAFACATAWLYWCDPRDIHLAAVVDYEPLSVVRATTPGFVRRILVADGEAILADQVIAELENAELSTDIVASEQTVAQSVAKSRMFREAGEIAKEQAETRSRSALETKLRELRARRSGLVVRAPTSGSIVSRGLSELEGRWLEEGTEIAVVGNESEKEFLVAVAQYDAELVRDRLDSPAEAHFVGSRETIPVRIGTLEPQAVRTLIHPALSVENGGPLPIYRREATDSGDEEQTTVAELHEPYFRLHGRLPADAATGVLAGRTATLTIRAAWSDVVLRTWTRLEHWIADKARS